MPFDTSLQATWIKHSITYGLQHSTEKGSSITSLNFVYEHPTISSLARYLMAQAQSQEPTSQVLGLESVLVSYTKDFPVHIADKEATTSQSSSGSSGGPLICSWLIQCC